MNDSQTTQLVSNFLSASVGWALAAFFSARALKDRDDKMDEIAEWTRRHMVGHPNMDEILRMHEENRAYMQHLTEMIGENAKSRHDDFKMLRDDMRLLTSRVDEMLKERMGK